jgi:hypothetical protein
MRLLNLRLCDVRSAGVSQLTEEFEMLLCMPAAQFSGRMLLQVLQSVVGLDDGSKLTPKRVANLTAFDPPLLATKISKIQDETVLNICVELAAMSPEKSIEAWGNSPLYVLLNKTLVTKLPRSKTVENWAYLKNDRSGAFFDK